MGHLKFKRKVQEAWTKRVNGDLMQILWNKLKEIKITIKDLNIHLAAHQQHLEDTKKILEVMQARLVVSHANDQLYE